MNAILASSKRIKSQVRLFNPVFHVRVKKGREPAVFPVTRRARLWVDPALAAEAMSQGSGYARIMTISVADVHAQVNRLWPESTAESWDRVGLVVGDPQARVHHIHLALDAVLHTVNEAVELDADLLLTHHPLLLRGVHTVASSTAKGAVITKLIAGDCALIAAHTNADQPEAGVSDVLAQAFGLQNSAPILEGVDPQSGIGRVGELREPTTLRAFAEKVASVLPATVSGVKVAGDPDQLVRRVALCGGSGDSLLSETAVTSADVYVTSDLRHHPASEAREQALVGGGPALIDVPHWAAESFWLETAAQQLREAFPEVRVTVSQLNTDPWQFAVAQNSQLASSDKN